MAVSLAKDAKRAIMTLLRAAHNVHKVDVCACSLRFIFQGSAEGFHSSRKVGDVGEGFARAPKLEEGFA